MPINYEVARDRENGSGTYYVYWRDGRSKRASLKTKDEAEANVRFREFLLKNDVDEKRAAKNAVTYTVVDYLDIYFNDVLRESASAKSAKSAWPMLKAHFGACSVVEVTKKLAASYVEKRTTGKLVALIANRPGGAVRKAGAVQPQSVRKELTYLRAALNYCSQKRHGKNLFDPNLIEPLDLPDEADPRSRWLTVNEIEALHDAARRLRGGERISRAERFLYLGLNTAGREQAIYDLTWSSGRIDFDMRTIDLNVPTKFRSNGKKFKMKGRAVVPMSDDLYVFLRRCYNERISDYVMDHKRTVWADLQRVAAEAGLAPADWNVVNGIPKATGISPHVLRHTAATHMARAGVPLWKVANILGNTTAIVAKVYAKFTPDAAARDAVNVMSRGLRAVPNNREDVG